MTAGTPLAPKLRFPEFQNSGGWKEKPLGKILKIGNGRGYKHLSEGEHPVYGTGGYMLSVNDYLYDGESACIGRKGTIDRPMFLEGKFWTVDTLFYTHSFKDCLPRFVYLIFQNIPWQEYNAASGVPSLSKTTIENIDVFFPKISEQQKIVNCLGSLDGLIAAEGRKLEALRQHKQGLMQQLFPRPGETAPRLRFPEFRDGSTWLAPQLDDLYDFKRTNTLSRDKLNYETGTIRNIHYGDIHTKFKPLFRVGNEHVPYINLDASANGFDDDAFCEEGDIVLADASEDLDDVGKAIEIVSLDGERVVAGTHTILATRRGSVPVVGFGGQLFQSAVVRAGIKKEAQGAKVYGISANRISAVPVPVPPTEPEQQRIADCLGWLDGLIAAQSRKIDTLKQHKQGLMQRLFPSPEGR